MTRMLFAAGALALAAAMTSGAAWANPQYGQTAAPGAPLAHSQYAQAAPPWHYEWQYHYGRHGEWAPGWVAVLDSVR